MNTEGRSSTPPSIKLKQGMNKLGMQVAERFDVTIPYFDSATNLNIPFTKLMTIFEKNAEENLEDLLLTTQDILEQYPLKEHIIDNTHNDPAIFSKISKIMGFDYQEYPQIRLILPVGAYGEDWTRRLLTTGIALLVQAADTQALSEIRQQSNKVSKRRGRLLIGHTFNNATPTDADSIPMGAQETLVQGIESIVQTAAYLTMHKVEGYEDPAELLHDIVASNLISQLALVISPFTTATLATSGSVFLDPTVIARKGTQRGKKKFILNDKIIKYFIEQRKDGSAITTGARPPTPRGCPVARVLPGREISGIDMGAMLLDQAIQLYNATSD
jgi:hypothetical protein